MLSDYSSDKIGIATATNIYEISDILFFIKSTDKFNILDFTTDTTRTAGIKLYPQDSPIKLNHKIHKFVLLPTTPTTELFTYNWLVSIIRCM